MKGEKSDTCHLYHVDVKAFKHVEAIQLVNLSWNAYSLGTRYCFL